MKGENLAYMTAECAEARRAHPETPRSVRAVGWAIRSESSSGRDAAREGVEREKGAGREGLGRVWSAAQRRPSRADEPAAAATPKPVGGGSGSDDNGEARSRRR